MKTLDIRTLVQPKSRNRGRTTHKGQHPAFLGLGLRRGPRAMAAGPKRIGRGGGAGGLAFDELQCNQNHENAADKETHTVCCDIVHIHRSALFKY